MAMRAVVGLVLVAVLFGVADAAPKKRGKGTFSAYLDPAAARKFPLADDTDDDRPPAKVQREIESWPDRVVIFVIDRSLSMRGEKLEAAKSLVTRTVSALAPNDVVGVVAFDSEARVLVKPTRAMNRMSIENDIAGLQIGGISNLVPGLQEASEMAQEFLARRKTIVVVTDAEVPDDGVDELAAKIHASQISIDAVGVAGADRDLLTRIAIAGSGRVRTIEDATSVDDIAAELAAPLSRAEARIRLPQLIEPTSLSIVLLFDRAALSDPSRLDGAKAAAQAVADALDGDDQVAILSFYDHCGRP